MTTRHPAHGFTLIEMMLAMVILGSANSLIGPVLGAAFFLAFRDVLSDYTEHWMLSRAAQRVVLAAGSKSAVQVRR